MLLPDAGNLLRQPDTAVIRTGGVANVHEVLLARSIASHGTIANLVILAIAARRHGWLGAASCRAVICADDPPTGVGSAA